ncbi:MAG TPA: hypothetical protein VN493_16470 [Thermoanaerobaculia bacterium]|nr:hypothetical protein [Thermoanaerobaculia bacterium]
MRNLQAVSLAIVMSFAVVPAFAETPENAPVASCPGEHAILASVLNDNLFTPAAPVSDATSQSLNYYYGYCSQDCTPCYSGSPYPQCPPDIYEGSPQACLRFRGC